MEKLAVVVDDEKTKTSEASTSRCPGCGGEIHRDPHRNVPWCPDCGTAPFEKKPVQK